MCDVFGEIWGVVCGVQCFLKDEARPHEHFLQPFYSLISVISAIQ